MSTTRRRTVELLERKCKPTTGRLDLRETKLDRRLTVLVDVDEAVELPRGKRVLDLAANDAGASDMQSGIGRRLDRRNADFTAFHDEVGSLDAEHQRDDDFLSRNVFVLLLQAGSESERHLTVVASEPHRVFFREDEGRGFLRGLSGFFDLLRQVQLSAEQIGERVLDLFAELFF